MEEIINDETLAGGNEFVPTDGGASDSQVVNIKDVLSETLGKEFPDDETALKAVKDTFSYVGQMGQKVKTLEDKLSKVSPEVVSKVDEVERKLEEATFYAENPQYKPYKDIIKSMGSNPEEVVKTEIGKMTLQKLIAHDESEKSKSVLMSNPRLGQVTDKISEAREAMKQGNADTAKSAAVGAVLDAYELR